MSENPYQSPGLGRTPGDVGSTLASVGDSEGFLKDRLDKIRTARRSWNRRCHGYGIAAILAGIGELNLMHFVIGTPLSSLLAVAYYGIGVALIVAGSLLHAFGPVSWFWFRRPV